MIRRVIRYGFAYWLVWSATILTSVFVNIPRGFLITVIYGLAVILPALTFLLFFARTTPVPDWPLALKVGCVWIAVITVFDVLFFVLFFAVPFRTYISWYLLLNHTLLLISGIGVAFLMRNRKSKHIPEGLA